MIHSEYGTLETHMNRKVIWDVAVSDIPALLSFCDILLHG